VRNLGETMKRLVIPEMNLGQVAGRSKSTAAATSFRSDRSTGETIPPERIQRR